MAADAKYSQATKDRANRAYVVCDSCGCKHGRKPAPGFSTMRKGRCDICRKRRSVADFRDYGYSKYNQ